MAPTSDNRFAFRLILIALAAVVLIVVITQYQRRSSKDAGPKESGKEKFPEFFEVESPSSGLPIISQPIKAVDAPAVASGGSVGSLAPSDKEVVRPHEPTELDSFKAVDFETESKLPADCLPRDRLTKDDLLPKDAANSKWAQANPAGQGDVQDQNFLTAGFHIGINTIGQSLRNPNYQLRSDPPNPRVQVSPWNQTTIEYDSSRRAFEIGNCE